MRAQWWKASVNLTAYRWETHISSSPETPSWCLNSLCWVCGVGDMSKGRWRSQLSAGFSIAPILYFAPSLRVRVQVKVKPRVRRNNRNQAAAARATRLAHADEQWAVRAHPLAGSFLCSISITPLSSSLWSLNPFLRIIHIWLSLEMHHGEVMECRIPTHHSSFFQLMMQFKNK